MLTDIGVAIVEAATGAEALQRAWSKPYPHLVLIDLSLPDCHGTDVVRALKQDLRTSDVPVVALSASVMAADKERAAQAGCAEFIEKPVTPDTMIAVVRRCTRRRRSAPDAPLLRRRRGSGLRAGLAEHAPGFAQWSSQRQP